MWVLAPLLATFLAQQMTAAVDALWRRTGTVHISAGLLPASNLQVRTFILTSHSVGTQTTILCSELVDNLSTDSAMSPRFFPMREMVWHWVEMWVGVSGKKLEKPPRYAAVLPFPTRICLPLIIVRLSSSSTASKLAH